MISTETMQMLKENGYYNIREVPGRGICGLTGFIFTVGLVEGLTEFGYSGRYCYPREKILEAVIAIEVWDGKDDPKGDWIKYKGEKGERHRTVHELD